MPYVADAVMLQVRVTVELLFEAVDVQGRRFTRILQDGHVWDFVELPLSILYMLAVSNASWQWWHVSDSPLSEGE